LLTGRHVSIAGSFRRSRWSRMADRLASIHGTEQDRCAEFLSDTVADLPLRSKCSIRLGMIRLVSSHGGYRCEYSRSVRALACSKGLLPSSARGKTERGKSAEASRGCRMKMQSIIAGIPYSLQPFWRIRVGTVFAESSLQHQVAVCRFSAEMQHHRIWHKDS
jgi:hypothetical protein